MHNHGKMRQRSNSKDTPVKFIVGGEGAIARESIAERTECTDVSEEVMSCIVADGPLAAEEGGFGGVVMAGVFWEVDEEGGDSHLALGYCVTCVC